MEAEHDEQWTPYVCPTDLILGAHPGADEECGATDDEREHDEAVENALRAARRRIVEALIARAHKMRREWPSAYVDAWIDVADYVESRPLKEPSDAR